MTRRGRPPRGLRWAAGVGLLTLLGAAPAPVPAQDAGRDAARRYREAHAAEILRDFAGLLALPNVASDAEEIRANARTLRERLMQRGVEVELLELPGAPPLVYGRLDAPGASRTLGLYAHYDGQPVDPSRWRHPPWEPTLYTRPVSEGGAEIPFPAPGGTVDPGWVVYARSAGDDKAPLGAFLPTLDALAANGITPTSNLVFLFEGEEEAGSPHLPEYLDHYRDLFVDVDLWLFLDGPVHQSGRPLLAFGARGFTGLEVTVYGPNRPLHSGHYGNWAPVPGMMLARLLASMKSEGGRVLVDGFYDTVAPLGEAEREALAALPDYDEELRHELGLARTEGGGAALAERLLLPSLTVRGLASGNVGERARNVIPATATATLGVRLVEGNDPERMLDLVEAHIRGQGYRVVRQDPDLATRLRYPKIAKVVRQAGYPAARSSMGSPLARQVIAAVRVAAGEDLVLLPGLGGSLPLYLFTEKLGAPAVIVPIANHDDNQHAANENLRIRNLWYGIDLFGALLTIPPRGDGG